MRIGYYGKLPHFEDFIASVNDDAMTTTIREWLNSSSDALLHSFGENVKKKFVEIGDRAMLLQPTGTASPMICFWSPSRDQSGRQAPFATYAVFDNDTIQNGLPLIPETFRPFLQSSRRYMESDNGSGFESSQEQATLSELVKTLAPDMNVISGAYTSYIEGTSIDQFVSAFDSKLGSGAGMQCLKNVFIALTPSRGTINESFRALFRFPLSGTSDTCGKEVAFWINMTEMLLDIKLSNQSIFWSSSQLNIFFGPCDTNILANVLTIDEDDDKLWDFSTMNLDGTMMDQDLYEKCEKVLNNNDSSLVDIQNVTTLLLATG